MPVVGMLAPVRPTAWVPWGNTDQEIVREASQVKSSQVKSSQVKSSQVKGRSLTPKNCLVLIKWWCIYMNL